MLIMMLGPIKMQRGRIYYRRVVHNFSKNKETYLKKGLWDVNFLTSNGERGRGALGSSFCNLILTI
jgi:hypothetical protein